MEEHSVGPKTYGLSQLQALRKWRRMTQQELSEASGVALSTIQKQERGNLEDAAVSVAGPLAKALAVPIEALWDTAFSKELLEQGESIPA
ncbi:hypothetical protein Dcar01_03677 [Deinococcus carri]|uniref:HTH cro/C1-type domain-containing protein n=1 Tax=Deinococcus carri TaxID=1211323 RepID=A0ABP9WFP5_9DEIO